MSISSHSGATVVLGIACAPKPAPTTHEPAGATPVTPPPLDCGPAIQGAAAVTGPGTVLLVGEIHGTAQVPEAVGRIVCHAARRPGAEVILGLEITSDDQSTVDAYLASDGTDSAVTALMGAKHFARGMEDGRSSQAMLQLLASVRSWRAAGALIEVVCFDAGAGVAEAENQRDASMASTLVAAQRARPGATLVVLSGNLHNRTVPGTPWDPEHVPMGVHLREVFPQLVSLEFRSSGGRCWACMGSPDGEVRCGVNLVDGEDRGHEPFVERTARTEAGFDGVLYVGEVTASEPASAGV